MNKLFTKIAALFLGMTMAVGVGVAVGTSGKETSPVNATTVTAEFVKHTTEIVEGDYVFYRTFKVSGTTYKKTMLNTSSNNRINDQNITLSSNKVVNPDDSIVWHIAPSSTTGYWTIKNVANNKYAASTGTKSQATLVTDVSNAKTLFSFSVSSQGNWTITNKSNSDSGVNAMFRHNENNSSGGWACMGNGTGPELYKKVETQTFTVTVNKNNDDYGSIDHTSIANVPSGSSITVNDNKVTINGTTVTATPATSDAQYTYSFVDWSNATGTVTADRIITANFERTTNSYDVTFDMQGHGAAISKQTIAYNGTVTKPTDPTADGYEFEGWFKESACTNAWDFAEDKVTKATVLYAKWKLVAKVYTVTDSLQNASLSSTADVLEHAAVNLTISAVEHYKLPASITVTMGGNAFSNYTYTRTSGNRTASFSIAAGIVEGDLDFSGSAIEDSKYSVTYTASTHGDGSYTHDVLYYAGQVHELLDFEDLTGVSVDSGYRFKDYTVGSQTKAPGDEITINDTTEVTVNFETIPVDTTYDFVTGFSTYASEWGNSYSDHEGLDGKDDLGGDYAATIDLYYASKQTGTASIKDRPVFATKTETGYEKIVGFTLTEPGYKIEQVVVTFKQWGTRTPSVAIFSGNAVSGTALDTASIGTKNTLTISDLNGLEFSVGYCDGSTSNVQAGITSIFVTLKQNAEPLIRLDKSSVEGFTTKTVQLAYASSENMGEITSYQWSITSGESYVSISSGAQTSTVTISCNAEGSAVVRLTASDGTVSAYAEATVSVQDYVLTVSWNEPNIKVFSGSSLTTSQADAWGVKYTDNAGHTNEPLDHTEFSVKLGGSVISLPHEWSASENGLELCVSYNGQDTSSVTVSVTQSLRPVIGNADIENDSSLIFTSSCGGSGTADDSKTWAITSDAEESTYDSTKGIHYGTGSAEVEYIQLVSDSFTSGTITKVVVNASGASGVTGSVSVTVGGNAFGVVQSFDSTASPKTFTGTASAGQIVVRIYKAQAATKAIYCKSVVVTTSTSLVSQDIANISGYEAAQTAVVTFAKAFNAAMDTTSGCTTNMSSAWSTASSAWSSFNTTISSMSTSQQNYAKALIRYASATWTKNTDNDYDYCLERAMATYEYCVKNHEGCNAFMSSVRPVERTQISPISIFGTTENTNMVAIVVIVSVVSLTAIGGYFFLKKRREQN